MPQPPAEPYGEEFHADPYPVYAWYREHDPVPAVPYPTATRPVWWVTRHADVLRVLSDPVFSNDPRSANQSVRAAGIAFVDDGGLTAGGMLFSDPPAHARRRRLATAAFGPRRIVALRASVAAVARELLAGLTARPGPADLIAEFATPLPIAVITGLLGVPVADQALFRGWLDTLMSVEPDRVAAAPAAGAALIGYLQDLLAEKRIRPADDLVSAFVAPGPDGAGGLTDAELVANLFSLLIGGYETTVHLIANGVLALLDHPEQLALLRAEPDRTPAAIEEFLRFEGPAVSGIWRFPREDVEIAGRAIPAGDPVLPLLASANHDPAVFADPDVLDITRPGLAHLAFGHGPHFCPGAALARLEAGIAFPLLLAGLPDLRLAVPRADLRRQRTIGSRGLAALPLAWTG